MSADVPLARLTGIERRFGPVVALAGADLELRPGEVHGVLGANGAGKTTLLRILGGMLAPDGGALEIEGRPVRLRSPREAWAHGIALVHQHFTLVPALTALENLALGLRATGSGSARARLRGGITLDLDALRSEIRRLVERTGLHVPLDRPVERLGVGDRQRTEILKALLRRPRLLVLDEPTAVLTPQEVDGLFRLLTELASEGRSVVLVAHKLDEVVAVANRVTVLREGRTVLSAPAGRISLSELVGAMVGPEGGSLAYAVGLRPGKPASSGPDHPRGREIAVERAVPGERRRLPPGDLPEVAHLEDVDVLGDPSSGDRLGPGTASTPTAPRGRRATAAPRTKRLDGVSLSVRSGEIVGVVGVEGNGQHELALVLSGRWEVDAGRVALPDAIGYIPQDRTTEGLVADFDLTENVALALLHDDRFRAGPWMRWSALRSEADALRRRFAVAAPGAHTRVGALSGGNQQRVVVGRELGVGSDLVIAENPTRGLDVAATSFVWNELRRLTRAPGRGPGVVLVSNDLDEVLDLSDRVFAMSRGRLIPVPDDRRTREGVGALMLAGGDA